MYLNSVIYWPNFFETWFNISANYNSNSLSIENGAHWMNYSLDVWQIIKKFFGKMLHTISMIIAVKNYPADTKTPANSMQRKI